MKISNSWLTMQRLLPLVALTVFCAPIGAQTVDAEISTGNSVNGSLEQGEWSYYRLDNTDDAASTVARLDNLTGDIDLYVQYGELPTLEDFICRSWEGGIADETCPIDLTASGEIYIGVYGYGDGNYTYTLLVDGATPDVDPIPGTSIGQRSGRIEWNGWTLDYDTFALSDGLTLHDVSFDGTPILNHASFPIMSVYYDNDVCGPYADKLNGPQSPVEWADNALLVAREYTQNGEQWFELGIREFIGSYDIYQAWYFGADGSLDGHVFSRGLQCDIAHIHYPMWRFDFDIDGAGEDQILSETASGTFNRYTTEFEASATDAFEHRWYVQDAQSGYRVRIDFDDGAWNLPGDVVPASAYENNRIGGMVYRESEKGWNEGPSPNFLYVDDESLEGDDIVMWYRGYLPHSPEEGSELWHSTGVRLRTDVQLDTDTDTDGDGIPDYLDPDDDNDGIPDELDPEPLIPNEEVVGSVTIESVIQTGNDDVEQRARGRVDFDSSDLELIFDANVDQIVGLRFNDLDIPQGANIVQAYLQFQTDERSSRPTTVTIHGVASDDADAWSSTRYDVSGRSRTSASVSWTPAEWNAIGEADSAQRTPDLSSMIEEIVGRSGWQQGNSASFVIEGSGERVAEAYEGSRSGAARLVVEYESADGNTAPDVDAGPDLTLSVAAAATLAGVVLDDGLPVPPGEVSLRWIKVSGPGNVSFDNDSTETTEAVFSEPGDYVLRLTANDGQFSGSDSLNVSVQDESGNTVIERRVSSSTDDAEENTSGAIALRSSDLELGVAAVAQTVGIRFTGVDIPEGATIAAAYIQFTVDEPNRASASLTLSGEASGNADAFAVTNRNVSSRSQTAATVNWSPAPWPTVGEAGSAQRTPDLSQIVQEIIDRDDWSDGNALVVLVTGSGQRTAESFNGDNTRAPILHIEYQ
ncbi:MAG: pre-peptidase C-terminal domain-containing protein [Granulosicoccus sp.]